MSTLEKALRFDGFSGCYQSHDDLFICSFSSVYCEVVRPAEGWFDLVKQVRRLSYRTA